MATKEGTYELQKLDCNCSDCKFMDRDILKRQEHIDRHYKWQKDAFDKLRMRKIKKAHSWTEKGELEKAKLLLKEARKMKFQFDESEASMHYANCLKYKRKITFLANVCMIETQDCFEHRKDV